MSVDDLIAKAAASNGASATQGDFANAFTDADLLKVFMGTNPTPPVGPALHADTKSESTFGPTDIGGRMHEDLPRVPWAEYGPMSSAPYVRDKVVDANTAANQIYGWSAKERNKWAQTLIAAGLIEEGNYNFADLVQFWQMSVQGAA